MSLIGNNLTIRESQQYLALNGVAWTQAWIRIQIVYGKIRSELIFNSRVIPKSELNRIIQKKRDELR